MGRRTYRQAIKGQVYAAEWVEWYVECAEPLCRQQVLVAPLGEVATVAEAEREAAKISGWRLIGGLWHCPEHAEKE